jgi:hypothetical protein
MDQAIPSFWAVLVTPSNLLVVLGVWVLLTTFQLVATGVARHAIFVRWLPAMPPALCIGALMVPGVPGPAGLGERLLLGLFLGFAVGHVHKLLTQTGLGRDARLTPPPSEPV